MNKVMIIAGVTSLFLLVTGCSAEKVKSILPSKESPPIQIVINGKLQSFNDGAPFKKDGTIMIPLRKVTEELGAAVKYKDETSDVLISKENTTILLHAGGLDKEGSNFVVIDGERKDMGESAMMIDHQTFVPISFVESIGGSQSWVSQDQTVQITLKNIIDDGIMEQIKIFIKDGKPIPGNTGLRFSWGTKYIGEMTHNEIPHGEGTLYSPSLAILYQGSWKNGLPHGKGTIEIDTSKKITLTGTFAEGNLKSGTVARNGSIFYEGDIGKKIITKGKLKLPDGFIFKGTISKDQKSGFGVIYSSSGIKTYEGSVAFDGLLLLNEFTYTRGVSETK
ncbi:stalk domain-containing protein [Paenibacillus sp. Leaf72]|uniref:stalk domain-containing protein n=1 Tax=Paenibacillus sp. Leaf72 TaxID=1736234 RepID=UPI0006FCD349|nr:stalk domain-containing protein [Paenibacillus sp. Leaf72]KQN96929.1 hypothetical protein ASF12_22940 [Paenibacillus sp. Leaf72]